LRALEGLVDIYLPDFKYFSDELARKYSAAPNYFQFATQAIIEMKRQTGQIIYDDQGIMKKGLIIRHLVLPGQVEDSKKILLWIKENLGTYTPLSLMAQYYPTYRAQELEGMNRRLRPSEYETIRQFFIELGFEQGFCQELSSASGDFTPDFEGRGV
jgi:putative pyruvate formate lyase activating enzyme